jgi:hypothetical protein
MNRILVAAAIAVSLIASATTADAGSRHKRHHAYRTWTVPVETQVGPIWSGPNQCWTDEGYGRYAPCNGRR